MTLIERPALRPAALALRSRQAGAAMSDSAIAIGLVVGATIFNALLAIANAHGVFISSAVVIGCEVLLTGGAVVVGLHGRQPVKQVWLTLAALIFAFALVNGFGSGGFDPKFIRDVLLIPVFVLLGLSCTRRDAIRAVLILQVIVVAVMLFEAIRPEDYARLFEPMSYYINSRGFEADSFWNKDSDLFVSATRPGDRFLLGGLDIHRLSSVFLEPVSLGNYCVIVAIVAAALWPAFSLPQRAFLVVSEVLIIIGCDGRFATVAIVLIVALRFVAPALPRYSNALYLPGIMAAAALAVAVFAIPPGGDDFPGRMAGTILSFPLLGAAQFFGFSTFTAYQFMDSGIVYLILSQSLLGAAVIWGFVALGMPQTDRASAVLAHAVSLYVSLLLLISYSFFSIKTAALLWFCTGAIGRPLAAYAAGPVPLRTAAPPEAQPA